MTSNSIETEMKCFKSANMLKFFPTYTRSGFYLLGGGVGGKLPPPKKSFTEKKLQLFQIKIFFDDDFKESVKVTNVQKCDFSQS